MDEKGIKEKFRPYLPKGYVDILRKRLEAKGCTYSRSKIAYVCDPQRTDYVNEIIAEALDLAAEEIKKANAIKEKLNLFPAAI